MTEARGWRMALALALAASMTACAHHGRHESQNEPEQPGRITQTRNGMASAAVMPLRDVGLIRPEVPDALENLGYPYKTDTLAAGCPAIAYEIAQLDAVLGDESYQPGHETTLVDRAGDAAGDYVENYAVGAVRDAVNIVPFRSWVRRLTGATSAEKKAARAIELGHTRRTFLRGYGAALGCTDVVPAPPPPRGERNRHRDHDEDQHPAATPVATPAPPPSPAPIPNAPPATAAEATPIAAPATEGPH